ncbi:MAG: NYN domain-containing protein [Planctomycetota bacterium]
MALGTRSRLLTQASRIGYVASLHTGASRRAGFNPARVLAAPQPGHFFSAPVPQRPERAIVFVDGSNWYHALRDAGVKEIGRLDFGLMSRKLVGTRTWLGTRYYVGLIQLMSDPRLYAGQRKFLRRLRSMDARVSVHLGRLESRIIESRAAREIEAFLAKLKIGIDPILRQDLTALARTYSRQKVLVEKAVDVMLAVDMVVLAEQDRFDVAYLLSTDGDFTPAVAAVRSSGRKVFAASPGRGVMLQGACNAFIRLSKEWFDDCRH